MFPDKLMCRGFHQIGINVSRQLELSYPSCARCFPLMSILPLGAASAVTPMWIAPLVRLTVRACERLGYDDCTRIAVGDTSRCVDESGNTQALYCMDKDVNDDVQHHAWTRVGFTLLCTVMQEEACGLSRGEKCL